MALEVFQPGKCLCFEFCSCMCITHHKSQVAHILELLSAYSIHHPGTYLFSHSARKYESDQHCALHSLKQSCGTCRSPLFSLGVMKNLTLFFQQISLQVLELVVICSVLHILCHTPLIISLFSYFSHLSLMYNFFAHIAQKCSDSGLIFQNKKVSHL